MSGGTWPARRAGIVLVALLVVACAPSSPPSLSAAPPTRSSPSSAGQSAATLSPSPSPRARAAMATDPASGDLLLFGGRAPDGTTLRDTWRHGAGGWSLVAGTVPLAGAMLAPDPEAGTVVLVGSDLRGGFIPAQPVGLLVTWLWRGGRWAEQHPAERPPGTLEPEGMAWSPAQHAVVLLGEDVHGLARRPQIWLWRDSTWHRPWQGVVGDDFGSVAARLLIGSDGSVFGLNLSSADAPGTRHLRLERFLGADGFAPVAAGGLAPPNAIATATDLGAAVAVVLSTEAGLLTTWELRDTTWRRLDSAPQPAARDAVGMTANHGIVLFGGARAGSDSDAFGDFWRLNGNLWSTITP